MPCLRSEGGGGMSDLEPCPFCGGEARVQHQSRELYGDVVDWYGVYCKKQFCGYVSGQSTEAEAIEAWNTRADDYRHAAEYWQRMYEEAFVERTCHNVSTTNNFRCSECDAADLDFDKPSYCHGCGAKVVSE